ncbi:hypothetical protein [Halalkalibacter alkaliphilus]|uniref:Uncharacterized protein n=1 Tax=Halalkalibacter alkaliphilus TaxID=2917993 RepID=A0A9X2I687_9BACI|nr:hypothetical protein [Halalkalibacter alkaliphilus]MCL7748762.1 hypothetical protein [Halalkalibacter alkaliphilus]
MRLDIVEFSKRCISLVLVVIVLDEMLSKTFLSNSNMALNLLYIFSILSLSIITVALLFKRVKRIEQNSINCELEEPIPSSDEEVIERIAYAITNFIYLGVYTIAQYFIIKYAFPDFTDFSLGNTPLFIPLILGNSCIMTKISYEYSKYMKFNL